ncbi:MAG: LysR family transcriptional regulator [Xanthobacteraceae bacterium]|nr:LysR family transcriptional regulator [Xanthobacteraceae bacterium]
MQQSADLDEIRAFVALAASGSFIAAASTIGRDPTVVSRRLSALEKRLGIRLVERTTRRIELTEAGRAYLSRVRPLLDELDAADRDASSHATGLPRGHLRVSLPGSFARLWLVPAITSFAQAHPHINLELHYTNRFVDLIAERFDIAVRIADLPDSRIVARKVGTRRRLLCASPQYIDQSTAIAEPADLPNHPGLIFTGRFDPFKWTFRNHKGDCRSVISTPRIASDDADVLVEAACAGLGILLTTDWHVGPAIKAGRLVEVLPEWTVVDSGAIYIVMPANGGVPAKTRAFSDWIASSLADSPWRTP